MITKERLEELIEQGATIYRTYADVCVQEVKLNKKYMEVDNAFLWQKMKGAFKGCGTPLDKLFETKEQAEWHKEFGCIERTERLELPTWEEFKLREPYNYFIFTSKDMQYGLGIGAYYREIIINNNGSVLFQEKFTKENYTLACRKAKELFLGESE